MENKPTQQYLNYLISTHVEVPCKLGYTEHLLDIIRLNSCNITLYSDNFHTSYLQTNLSKNNTHTD